MALDNLISISFTEFEAMQIQNALIMIENVMAGKAVNLSPKQRQTYGRVKYDMEVWVNKVSHYMQQNPQLIPSYIDNDEHNRDMAAHTTLNPLIERMETVLQKLLDTNLLLGTDLYNNSIAFYRSMKMAAQSNAPGAAAIYADLKQQFPGGGKMTTDGSATT